MLILPELIIFSNIKANVEDYFERGKGVWGDVKGGELHVAEEAVEVLRVEDDPRQGLVPQTLSQHHSTVQSHFWAVVSAQVSTRPKWVRVIYTWLYHCKHVHNESFAGNPSCLDFQEGLVHHLISFVL